LKPTAKDLLELKVIDGIIPEPLGGAHRDYEKAAEAVKKQITKSLKKLGKLKVDKLIDQRVEKYASMGDWEVASDKKD